MVKDVARVHFYYLKMWLGNVSSLMFILLRKIAILVVTERHIFSSVVENNTQPHNHMMKRFVSQLPAGGKQTDNCDNEADFFFFFYFFLTPAVLSLIR